MSRDDPTTRAYAFGPLERRGLVGGLRLSQAAPLATASLLAVLGTRLVPSGSAFVIGLVLVGVTAAAVFQPVRGRTLDQWLPVVVGWLWLRKRRSFRSSQPVAGLLARLDGSEPEVTPSLPLSLMGCEILSAPVDEGRDVGLLRDPLFGTLTGVLAVRVKAFGLLGDREQERRLERWGRLLAGLARNDRAVRRIAVLERTVPADGDELQRYLVEARDRELEAASATRSYESLLQGAGDVTQDHELFVSLQVDERRAVGRAGRRGRDMSPQRAAQTVLLRELVSLASRFDPADVVVDGVLTPRMLARAVRLAFDPYGRERLSRFAAASPETAGVNPGSFGPVAAEAAWDHYRTDSAFHRTYWVAQWPRVPVGPAFLSPLLLNAQVVRSVAITIEPVPPDRARRAVEAAVTAEEADEQLRAERGFRTTARRRKQHQAATLRERELAEGHQEVRFSGFVTVSGRDLDELDVACEQVELAAHQAYLDLQPMWGQQDAAFLQGALPLGRGLRSLSPLGAAS